MPKNGFFVYFDKYLPIKNLTYEQKGKIFEASYRYNAGEDYAFDDPVCELAFSFIKPSFDFFNERAEAKSEKYRNNGRLGGLAKASNAKQKLAMASNAKQDLATSNDFSNTNTKTNTKNNTPLTPQGGSAPRSKIQLTKAESQTQIDEYTDNPELRESLAAFFDSRRALNKPLTARALQLALKELDKLAVNESDKTEIVNQSVLHGWQSFFALKPIQTTSAPRWNQPVN